MRAHCVNFYGRTKIGPHITNRLVHKETIPQLKRYHCEANYLCLANATDRKLTFPISLLSFLKSYIWTCSNHDNPLVLIARKVLYDMTNFRFFPGKTIQSRGRANYLGAVSLQKVFPWKENSLGFRGYNVFAAKMLSGLCYKCPWSLIEISFPWRHKNV